jgi:hypothetical protein
MRACSGMTTTPVPNGSTVIGTSGERSWYSRPGTFGVPGLSELQP